MTMKQDKVSKTRILMVDVARQLFALKGKDNVTMNDIAVASNKGRRTLYTYFRNKDEVYLAVIENELNLLIERLQIVMQKNIRPDLKLEEYIFVRFEAIKEAVDRNGSLRADFFRNIYEVEKARRSIDIKEIRMLRMIFEEGVEKNIFKINNPQWAAMLILYALKGIEAPYLNHNIGSYIQEHHKQIINTIFNGILKNNS